MCLGAVFVRLSPVPEEAFAEGRCAIALGPPGCWKGAALQGFKKRCGGIFLNGVSRKDANGRLARLSSGRCCPSLNNNSKYKAIIAIIMIVIHDNNYRIVRGIEDFLVAHCSTHLQLRHGAVASDHARRQLCGALPLQAFRDHACGAEWHSEGVHLGLLPGRRVYPLTGASWDGCALTRLQFRAFQVSFRDRLPFNPPSCI